MTAMLAELAEFERRFGEALVDDMRKTANLLLRNQFLFAGDRRASHAYEQAINLRYRGYFTALFDALGYILRVTRRSSGLASYRTASSICSRVCGRNTHSFCWSSRYPGRKR
jgi:hypothetical protein